MDAVTGAGDIRRSAQVLNIVGRANVVPTLQEINYLSPSIRMANSYGDPYRDNPLRLGNANTALVLMLQHLHANPPGERQDEWRSQVMDDTQSIIDYALNLARQGRRIESTTFNGLKKRSELWHREIATAPLHHQWSNILAYQDNTIRTWNSLLGPTQQGSLTITPLTDEHQLYQESLAMSHCVISYGPQCADGESRIFSVSDGDRKLATAQIRLENQTWIPTQIRGPHNHPVTEQVTQAVDNLALAYTEEHHRAPAGTRHQEWSVPAEKQHQPQTAPSGRRQRRRGPRQPTLLTEIKKEKTSHDHQRSHAHRNNRRVHPGRRHFHHDPAPGPP